MLDFAKVVEKDFDVALNVGFPAKKTFKNKE